MKRAAKWGCGLLLGLVAVVGVAGLARKHPGTALGIGACVAAVFVGLGLRWLLGIRKPVDTDAGAAAVMGQMMADTDDLAGGDS